MLIAPSVLSADFSQLGHEIRTISEEGADWIHIDVMDGHFVPNLTLGPPIIKSIRKYSDRPFDVHLMISDPLRYIRDYADAGADIISFHIESDSDPWKTIEAIESCGVKPAVAVKPKTDPKILLPYLDRLYMVLVMTVEPGFGGQSFMGDMIPKVSYLKEKKPDLLLQVDGGINLDNIAECSRAGVGCCVAGTTVFKAPDRRKMIADLKERSI